MRLRQALFCTPLQLCIAVTFLSDYGERKMTVFWGTVTSLTLACDVFSRLFWCSHSCQFWFLQVFGPRDFATQLRKDLTELPEPLSHKVLCQPRLIFSLENSITNLTDAGNDTALEMRKVIGVLWETNCIKSEVNFPYSLISDSTINHSRQPLRVWSTLGQQHLTYLDFASEVTVVCLISFFLSVANTHYL